MGNPLSALLALLGTGNMGPQQPQQGNLPMSPIAGKLAALSGMQQQQPSAATPPFLPQQQGGGQPAMPMPAQGAGGGDISGAMMQAAQQAMNNPAAQPVPSFSGGNLGATHPNLANIINALSQGASAYGWTAMAPPERLERMKMEQEKAQAMAQLAGNQQYREGELEYRNQMAKTAQQNADTKQANEESQADMREFQKKNQQDRLDFAKTMGEANLAIRQGRLGQAQELLDQKATQFEQKMALAGKKFGLDQAKVELSAEGNEIKKGFLAVAQTALNQKGTIEGTQAITKLQQIQLEHPILSQFFGLDDISDMVRQSQSAPIPGTGTAQPPQGGAIPAIASGTATPSTPKKKAAVPGGGVTHVYVPGQGITPVGPGG